MPIRQAWHAAAPAIKSRVTRLTIGTTIIGGTAITGSWSLLSGTVTATSITMAVMGGILALGAGSMARSAYRSLQSNTPR